MRILITGCARSGTSLTSQICGALGANLGTVNGLYENTPIREGVLKPMIEAVGGDRMGQINLPARDADPDWQIRHKVEAELGKDWAYKGVKMLLVWRNWVREFPEARWVFVRRKIDDIASSCLRTNFMTAYKTHEEWRTWASEYIIRLTDLSERVDFVEVWPHEAINGDLSGYQKMAEHVGLEWNEDAVKSVINRKKWHA